MFSTHAELAAGSRLPALSRVGAPATRWEWLAVLFFGAGAALSAAVVDLGVRVPGHAILRSVFPMALGLALVPRHGAGSVMGITALATAMGLRLTGGPTLGLGASTSLALTGPFLDLALSRARAGWQVYLGCCAAGLASNLAALALRGGGKLGGVGGGGRPIHDWWRVAWLSYPACGVLAGLLGAIVWFHLRPRRSAKPDRAEEAA
jgi:hypothetical protein